MSKLHLKIQEEIEGELDRLTSKDGLLAEASNLRLVLLVGNGLSRFALRHSKGTDLSYDHIVEGLARDARLAALDHLKARGYAVDEIFREAASRLRDDKDRISRVFRELWNTFATVEPSPLHSQIAVLGRAFLTTNYDLLLEKALHKVGRYQPKGRWPHPRMTVHSGAAYPFPQPGSYSWDEPPLYKIHGSFPDLHDDGRLPDSGEINWWLRGDERGDVDPPRDLLVIDSKTYDYWSWYCPEDKFIEKFRGPFDLLHDPKNLIVPLGHGLSAEERILFRLRELAGREAHSGTQLSARGLIPLFATDLDEPAVRLPYGVVRIHPALAGSPPKRELALMLLLGSLARRGIITARHRSEAVPPELQFVAEQEPRTVMLGQVALHTNRGYEDAPAQERAYSPPSATWAPGVAGEFPLEAKEPFGDALIPALLWDAIGLPCALEGRVGCDEAGRRVYDHLIWKTSFVDFRPVQQDRDATEQATVASWFDLRLILDGLRRGAGELAAGPRGQPTETSVEDRADLVQRAVPPRPGRGRYLYVTKPGWNVAKAVSTDEDVVVFDTGNNCNAGTFAGVLGGRAVVIASALSLWMLLRTAEGLESADLADHERLTEVWDSLREKTRPLEEPKDETGRYEQFVGLLRVLEKSDFSLAGSSIASLLGKTISVSVSLGPLGVLWWSADDWSQAHWTRIEGPEEPPTDEAKLTGQAIPFSQIRCGLGCGDSSRAGFAATLQLHPGLEPAEIDKDLSRLPLLLAPAFEAMNWWGASRLMFWSITSAAPGLRIEEDDRSVESAACFRDWLASHKTEVREKLVVGSAGRDYFWPDGSTERRLCTKILAGDARTKLLSYVELWENEIVTPRRPKGHGGWVEAVARWRRERKL